MRYTVSAKTLGKIKLSEKNHTAATLQRLAILLSTFQGEVVLHRDFGISRRSLDKPVPVARAMLITDVYEAVLKFVPETRIVELAFEADEGNPGALAPVLEVDI